MNDATPDLLDTLLAEYHRWRVTGRVKSRDVEIPLKVDPPAAGTVEPEPGKPGEGFCYFVRAYMRLNPVVSAGFSLGAFGVFLADGQHLLFVRDSARTTESPNYYVPITGNHGRDPLPPSWSVPITKG